MVYVDETGFGRSSGRGKGKPRRGLWFGQLISGRIHVEEGKGSFR